MIYHDKISKSENRFIDSICNIYLNAARFHWSQQKILDSIEFNVYDVPEYKKLPRYSQSKIEGGLCVLRKGHEKLLVFSYEIDGVRMTIREERYRKISPQIVHEKYSHTGAFVYRKDPTSIYYQKEQNVEKLV
jgi:hypothetical protein